MTYHASSVQKRIVCSTCALAYCRAGAGFAVLEEPCSVYMDRAIAEVKEQLGKDQYKHRLLPLLRQYRQTKDASHFTSGLRSLATPLLPNADLLQAFSLLLPKALQKAFIAQLETATQQTADCPVVNSNGSSAPLPKRRKLTWEACLDEQAHAAPVDHHPNTTASAEQGISLAIASKPVTVVTQADAAQQQNKQDPQETVPKQQSVPNSEPSISLDHTAAGLKHQVVAKQSTAETRQFQGNARKIKDAEAFQRQKERRQKKAAFLLDGTTTGPVVALAGQSSWGQATQQHALRLAAGYTAHLPVRPNRSQVLLMQSITSALQHKRHALLESPTGTGKTLALMCATLAWQQQQQDRNQTPRQVGSGPETPRIFWAARTHAQIDHAVREVRRTCYRPMMTILASRERFCLHPDIATAPNKTEACEGATMGPEHLPAYKPGGRLETFDIEELVAEGKAGHVCPYHASRDVLQEGAALIFITYSQLLDPPVRSANGLDDLIKGAVLVFDEAHNIAGECRAAATLQMSTTELEDLASDLGRMQGSLNKMAPASKQWRQAADFARELAHLVDTMQGWLARSLCSTTLPFQKEQGVGLLGAVDVWEGSGQAAHSAVLNHLNLSIPRVQTLQDDPGRLKAMRRGLIEGGYESTAVKSGAINQLEGLLSKLLFVLQTRGMGYRCILSRQSTAGRPRRGAGTGQGREAGPVAPVQGSFSFLCLHAAVALTPLIPSAHSLLLTSGTLSPMDPLVAELGIGAKLGVKLGGSPDPDSKVQDIPSSEQSMGAAGVTDSVPAWAKPRITEQLQAKSGVDGSQTGDQAVKPTPSADLVSQGHTQQAVMPHVHQDSDELKQEPMSLSAAPGSMNVHHSNGQLPAVDLSEVSASDAADTTQQGSGSQPGVHLSELHSRRASNASATASMSPETGARQRSQHSRLHQQVELVSAPHSPTLPQRLLPLTISMAPDRNGQLVKLDSAYDKRQNEGYLDAVGSAVVMACSCIPSGLLCFFPSWSLLNACRDRWLLTGLYEQLCASKLVIMEPSNASGEVFDDAIKSYREAAEKPNGAILLAVMRGRSSEGVDFLDACARAVLVIGIPYPPLYDVTVRLKRAFNHDHEALLGSGDDWYAAEAFRAVNQAVGRLIRHQRDYGAVLLLDHRYNILKFRQLTPAWLQPLLTSTAMSGAPAMLRGFFRKFG